MSKVKAIFSYPGKLLNKHPLIFFAAFSIIENLVIESLSRHSVIKGFAHLFSSPLPFLINSLIIMLTLSFSLLFRRRVFGLVIFSMPWLICGIVNCVILSFRVTPLSAIDFHIAKLSLILLYLTPWQRILIYTAIGVFVIGMVTLWILGPKISGKMNYGKNVASIAGILVSVLVLISVGRSIEALSDDFGNLVGAYDDYGFIYCFSNSVLVTGIDKPPEYSEEKVKNIISNLPQTNNTDDLLKPDVILIQLESFVDPKNIKNLSFSDDPAPIHTYLRENFAHGGLFVPSFGGGTANTEFEVLTGVNLENFGPGEYPYKTVMLNETCESLAYNLKENGYSAHAIHNHTGNFYDRDKVYPNMGFDSFQSQEYMNDYEETPYGWCKDGILAKEIMTALTYTDEKNGVTADTPRFVWTVSVQGHGKYPTGPIEGDDHVIKVKSDTYSEEELYALEYYSNQVWEMDMFLGSLISALENRERPTILIAYGDHLPAIGLEEDEIVSGNVYMTEYVTWCNFDIDAKNRNLKSYELSAEILEWLGFNNGNFTKLNQMKKDSSYGMTEEAYQEAVYYLSYDMLYGENHQYNGKKPYEKTEMRMGTIPVVADDIRYLDNSLYVQGNGFTAKSTIFVNGKKYDTIMLSPYSIMATDVDIKDGDVVSVGQSSSKKEVLGYSNEITYDKSHHCED